MNIFCVTNSELDYLEKLPVKLVGVGNKKFSKKYITCLKGKNIQAKEKNYSELTFHYWFWKNKLKLYDSNSWIGFCQKRRFWMKSNKKISSFKDLKDNIIIKSPAQWKNFDSIICKSIRVDRTKKMKLIKRGWKNLIENPKIFFDENTDLTGPYRLAYLSSFFFRYKKAHRCSMKISVCFSLFPTMMHTMTSRKGYNINFHNHRQRVVGRMLGMNK